VLFENPGYGEGNNCSKHGHHQVRRGNLPEWIAQVSRPGGQPPGCLKEQHSHCGEAPNGKPALDDKPCDDDAQRDIHRNQVMLAESQPILQPENPSEKATARADDKQAG
jgi:hypothetical protein